MVGPEPERALTLLQTLRLFPGETLGPVKASSPATQALPRARSSPLTETFRQQPLQRARLNAPFKPAP